MTPQLENKEGRTLIPSPLSAVGGYFYDARADNTEILWKCLVCGELKARNKWVLSPCPACGAPKSQFVLVDED